MMQVQGWCLVHSAQRSLPEGEAPVEPQPIEQPSLAARLRISIAF